MAVAFSFTSLAGVYMNALFLSSALMFFALYHIVSIDKLKRVHVNPIKLCNSLNPIGETLFVQ